MLDIWAAYEPWLVNYMNTRAVYSTQFKDKSADDLKSFFGFSKTDEGDVNILRTEDDTAFIDIKGFLSPDGPDRLDRTFGFAGTGYKQIIAAVDEIDTDNIKNLRLKMNTPGGMVQGVDNVWKRLMAFREHGHIVAVNEGLLASAGYYIASAAHEIHSMSEANESGSIGIMFAGIDLSKMREKNGIQKVVIVSKNAPDKNIEIGTEEGQEILQKRADTSEQFFLDRINAGRKVSVDDIKANFGRGGLLFSKTPNAGQPDALSVGMIDKIIDISKETGDSSSPVSITSAQENFMTLVEFLAANPDAKAEYDRQIEAKGQAEYKRGEKAGADAAVATAERVFTFMKPDSAYSKDPNVQKVCVAVLKGEQPESNLDMTVTTFDMMHEKKKSKDGKKESSAAPETPGDHSPPKKPGVVNDEESMNAAVEEAKKMC